MAQFQAAPMGFSGEAVDFGFGTYVLPPASRVAAYVCSTKPDGCPTHIASKLRPTLASAVEKVRASRQDWIVVLPGHSESGLTTNYFTSASQALVAGTQIRGYGHGSLQPTFTWTGTTNQIAISVANVQISGLKFAMNGANDITKAMNITGADVKIENCLFDMSAATDLHAAIGIEVGTGAHRFKFWNNKVIGASDAVTDVIKMVAVTNDVSICGNDIDCPGPATTTGLINLGAVAALRLRLISNTLVNPTASSDWVVVTGAAASTGFIHDNWIAVLNDTAAAAEGFSFGAGCLIQLGENKVSNKVLESGLLAPAASA